MFFQKIILFQSTLNLKFKKWQLMKARNLKQNYKIYLLKINCKFARDFLQCYYWPFKKNKTKSAENNKKGLKIAVTVN